MDTYAFDTTIGFLLVLIGIIIWFWASWINRNKNHNSTFSILGILGMLLNSWGFSQIIAIDKLSKGQFTFALFIFFIYMVVFLYAFHAFQKERKQNRIKLIKRLEDIEQDRIRIDQIFKSHSQTNKN